MSDVDVIVIGAGLAGLSAACHLRGAGRSVTVLEAGDVPGGRAGVAHLDGYRFDTGPTVLTMPDIIRDCFTALGADMDAYLHLGEYNLDPLQGSVEMPAKPVILGRFSETFMRKVTDKLAEGIRQRKSKAINRKTENR